MYCPWQKKAWTCGKEIKFGGNYKTTILPQAKNHFAITISFCNLAWVLRCLCGLHECVGVYTHVFMCMLRSSVFLKCFPLFPPWDGKLLIVLGVCPVVCESTCMWPSLLRCRHTVCRLLEWLLQIYPQLFTLAQETLCWLSHPHPYFIPFAIICSVYPDSKYYVYIWVHFWAFNRAYKNVINGLWVKKLVK